MLPLPPPRPREASRACRMVLHASIGMRNTRKLAAAPEAATVLTPFGRSLVNSNESHSAIMPAFDAVSPKRESGP